jgi:ribosomal protein S18 acetylase RimI-like enzyme
MVSREVVIREAVPEDAKGVARVQVDTWRTTYRGMVPDEYFDGLSYESSEQRWGGAFSNPDRQLIRYVAEDTEGTIVGFAVGGPQRSSMWAYEGELYAIYVLQEAQGRGIGGRLAREVARRLFDAGMRSMIVWVLTDNHPSRRFYEALGGILVAEQEFELDGLRLHETGYGWADISTLLGD